MISATGSPISRSRSLAKLFSCRSIVIHSSTRVTQPLFSDSIAARLICSMGAVRSTTPCPIQEASVMKTRGLQGRVRLVGTKQASPTKDRSSWRTVGQTGRGRMSGSRLMNS